MAAAAATTLAAAPGGCADRHAPVMCETNALRKAVWRLQDQLGEPRYLTNYSDRRPHASTAYRKWVRNLWRKRHRQVKERYAEWRAISHRAALLAIARCETGGINGGEPLWTHYNSTYAGALGFLHSTWDHYAPPSFPRPASAATPWQQLYVGQVLVNTFGGFSSWPACSVKLGLR